jgi:hypothetical protein
MAYQYNPQTDSEHDWVFVDCFTNISPSRPPNFNHDNLSSSEAGTPANDPNAAAKVLILGMDMNNLPLVEHAPPSYPSSNDGSIRAPDGPEREDPPNRFLAVAPVIGLGEIQHRRRSSWDRMEDQINSSVSRWAMTLPPDERHFHAEWEEPVQRGFLPLATRIMTSAESVKATRGKSSGSASVLPSSGNSGESSVWPGSNTALVAGSGEWIRDSLSGGWPYDIPEDAFEEEDD